MTFSVMRESVKELQTRDTSTWSTSFSVDGRYLGTSCVPDEHHAPDPIKGALHQIE